MMQTRAQNITVADYCQMMDRGELRINSDYQRSAGIWPNTARSFLIETILLGLPVPKLALQQKTDLKTRTTYKDIIDGQQRSQTVFDFFSDSFRLSRTIELGEAAGKAYSDLSEELQEQFLDYSLDFDLFIGATEADVREVFRRINSHTATLNPEEQRHAEFQGPFKWFIHRLSGRHGEALKAWGVLTEKQLIRMQEAKLLTEICHALKHGITTTNKNSLRKLYRELDGSFAEEAKYEEYFRTAFDRLASWSSIHRTEVMKPYNLYSLVLALIAVEARPADLMSDLSVDEGATLLPDSDIEDHLAALATALENDDEDGPYRVFIKAASDRTNVAEQRRTRGEVFVRALTDVRFGH